MVKLLNSICTKTIIGGGHYVYGANDVFDPNIILNNNTYYWDDGTSYREGFSISFPNKVIITRIEVYSTDHWVLGDVRIEMDNKAIYRQDSVSHSRPLIWNTYLKTNKFDIVRYTVRDSVIAKILIYGFELDFLIKENNNYYTIKKEYYNKETKMFNPLTINSLSTDIITHGFKDLDLLFKDITVDNETFKPIDKFNNFKIVCPEEYNISVYGKKSNQELILANNDINISIAKTINYFKLQNLNNNVRIIFSIDKGNTWKTYENSEIKDLSIYEGFDNTDLNKSINIIKEHGITPNILYTIDFNKLNITTIRFAYLIIDDGFIDKLIWQFNSKGVMELCDKSDVRVQLYYAGVKLISNIDNAILKTNITYEGINDN